MLGRGVAARGGAELPEGGCSALAFLWVHAQRAGAPRQGPVLTSLAGGAWASPRRRHD